ncbi:MAG: carbohydrate porin [Deltaproteobacteria bacterium]|nr:carbohydrate porin [Deltaproteobacteria bacterium]
MAQGKRAVIDRRSFFDAILKIIIIFIGGYMGVSFFYRIKTVFAALIMLIVCFPLLSFAAEDQLKQLEQKIEAIEKKTDDLEKEIRMEHKPLLKEISEHITTLEKELDTVDYRTARIKALGEKVEAFSIGGDLSLFLQGIGNNSKGYGEKADASYSGDLFLITPAGPYGNVYFRGAVGEGAGIAPLLPPTFSGPNADLGFNEPKFELVEAWYWTEFAIPDIRDKRLELTIGKMDPTALFDTNKVANSETNQFLANIFVNNLAIEFGGDGNGYGPGLSTAYRFTSVYEKGLKVVGRIGIFEGNGDFKDVLDKPFLIAELDIWRPYYGLNGNYRIYGWVNKKDHTDLLDSSKDNLSNQGAGLSIDQQVSNDITLFARYGFQDKDVSKFDQIFTIGGQIIGNSWRMANDVIGIAYGASHVSSKYKEASLGLDGYAANADYEQYLEAYYKYWANKNLSISPDLQYVINPGGDNAKDSIFIYGVRMQATF